MTSNLQIAQELWKPQYKAERSQIVQDVTMKQHAQDCQNFLKVLKFNENKIKILVYGCTLGDYFKDLKDTLKFYKEKGVIE